MRNLRTRIWIDRFQTYLFLRTTFYFILYQAAVWFFVYIERTSSAVMGELLDGQAMRYCMVVVGISVVGLTALFVYDAIRFTHRLVGPLYRFRKVVQAITAGDEMQLVRLRQGDFLMDLKDDFNEMLKALEQRGAITLKTDAKAEQPAGV
jgi:methyl-accepting chemotaxis protein